MSVPTQNALPSGRSRSSWKQKGEAAIPPQPECAGSPCRNLMRKMTSVEKPRKGARGQLKKLGVERMEGNGQHVNDSALLAEVERKAAAEHISIAQLQQLVRLLDNTEVSEIEIKRAASGTRLVLRKARLTEGQAHFQGVAQEEEEEEAVAPVETRHTVVAPLVGIFHTWAKPKGKTLVAVGDRVKVGQLVGTIQS
ncbi:MAG TPA: hypothetical protein VGN34_09810, partial [Ktedonobacteraceae bacterium]